MATPTITYNIIIMSKMGINTKYDPYIGCLQIENEQGPLIVDSYYIVLK